MISSASPKRAPCQEQLCEMNTSEPRAACAGSGDRTDVARFSGSLAVTVTMEALTFPRRSAARVKVRSCPGSRCTRAKDIPIVRAPGQKNTLFTIRAAHVEWRNKTEKDNAYDREEINKTGQLLQAAGCHKRETSTRRGDPDGRHSHNSSPPTGCIGVSALRGGRATP